jgi:hypothetical protein
MDKPRPYLTAALLCERVLEEKDGTLSVIKIADRVTYRAIGLPSDMKPLASVTCLVCLKSGPVEGDHTLRIFVERPKGGKTLVSEIPVNLLGKDHGRNFVLNLSVGIDQDGLYWFDVVFDDELLTRIPLLFVQEQAPAEQSK